VNSTLDDDVERRGVDDLAFLGRRLRGGIGILAGGRLPGLLLDGSFSGRSH
jgi:hypothetical protein